MLTFFVIANLNRWLLLLEVLIGRVEALKDGLHPATETQQLLNASMVSTVLHTLRFAVDTDPNRHWQIWRPKWRRKRGRRSAEVGDPSVEQDEEVEEKLGLDFKTCFETHGTAYLPDHLVEWNNVPLNYKHDFIDKLGIAAVASGFGKKFKGIGTTRIELASDHLTLDMFREIAREDGRESLHSTDRSLQLGAQLCVRLYIKEVFDLLLERDLKDQLKGLYGAEKVRERKRCIDDFNGRLRSCHQGVEDGLAGLDIDVLDAVAGTKLVLSQCKPPEEETRNGITRFGDHNTGYWSDKVMALFDFDLTGSSPEGALGAEERRQPTWSNRGYRIFTRRIYNILVEERGKRVGKLFKNHILASTAASSLLAIPRYDIDHLSTMHKAKRAHSKEAFAIIKSLSQLERTQVIVPILSEDDTKANAILYNRETKTQDKLDRATQIITNTIFDNPDDLKVYTTKYREGAKLGIPTFSTMRQWPDTVEASSFLAAVIERLGIEE